LSEKFQQFAAITGSFSVAGITGARCPYVQPHGRCAVKSARPFELFARVTYSTEHMSDFADSPARTDAQFLLGELLKNVSRSFYLTLRVLPAGLRTPIGLGYLLARAADTIADTALIPSEARLDLLLGLRAHVNGLTHDATVGRIQLALAQQQTNRHERVLLESLAPALQLLDSLSDSDRAEVRAVVTTLTMGMEFDLRTFPSETSGQLTALKTREELDRYTYYVAGCVGDFWTRITVAHTPALRQWNIAEMSACGIRFGKALQMTNVLRDCPKDLRIGRCYLPLDLLEPLGLKPEDLLDPATTVRARPMLVELLRVALDHFREARRYVLAIPADCGRLRLACLWPVVIGIETLRQLAQNKAWLDPARPTKVTRKYVYRTMLFSLPTVGSDTVISRWIDGAISAVENEL
jgi:farnesyl-diphosphate farnesyltransferase